MLRPVPFRFATLMAVAIVGLCAANGFAESAPDESARQEAVDAAKAQLDTVVGSIQALQKQSALKQADVSKLKSELALLENQLSGAQTELQKKRVAVTQAEETAKKAGPDTAEEAKAQLAVAQKDFSKGEADARQLEEKVRSTRETILASEREIAAISKTVTESQGQLVSLEASLLQARKSLEEALIANGKSVSFAASVAPILAKRCLACHNARVAKGRLNMDTFAAMMKGGESGAVVNPGDGEFSTLFVEIESGSMPKGADPLSSDEQALIKKWIETGAKLDVGLNPTSPLIEIMPKLPQPGPPEHYRVPLPVTAIAFNATGDQLASSGYHEVLIWSSADGQLLRRITNVAQRTYDIHFSNDGATIAVAAGTPGQVGEIKLFEVATGELLADLVRTEDSVFAVAFSPDGTRLAAGGADRSVRVYDIATGEQKVLVEDHADWVMDVAWSPDGKTLASASRDKTAKLFSAEDGSSLTTFNGHGEVVFCVDFTPDGKQVVTGGRDGHVRVWNASDASETQKIGNFGSDILHVEVTPDGNVFSCNVSKPASLNNLKEGTALQTFNSDWASSLDFNPQTGQFATGSFNGMVRLWKVDDATEALSFVASPSASTTVDRTGETK